MHKTFRLGLASGALLLVVNVTGCPKDSAAGNRPGDGGISSIGGGDLNKGEAAVNARTCKSCHGADLSGADKPYMGTSATYPANITPDEDTGIGGWDDAKISQAILSGVDDEDEQLCPTMPHFKDMGMDAAEAADIIAYLRSIPAVKHEVAESSCPPVKGGDQGGGADK